MDTSKFTVTERAGDRIAGRRVKKGDKLELTEIEARDGVLEGALVPEGEELSPALRIKLPKPGPAIVEDFAPEPASPGEPDRADPASAPKPPKPASKTA